MKFRIGSILFLFFCGLVSNAQAPNPISALLEKAHAGDASAQFEVARAYEDGHGVTKDDAQAVQWYQKSADQDYPAAENSLGVMYALGRGVPRDREKALEWYRKAAKHGLSEALYNVGISYYNGEGIEENFELAYAFMRVAQSKGNPQAGEALAHITDELHGHLEPAQLKLAEMYEKGEDLTQDFTAAARTYEELADLGPKHTYSYAPAEFGLCRLYLDGKGVPRDYAEAFSRCKLAAKNGIALAAVVLGRMTAVGLGTKKDIKKAAGYYENAAIVNEPEAFMELGKLRSESGDHEDAKEAYFWFYLAQKRKVPNAGTEMQNAAARLSEREIAFIQRKADLWWKMPLYQKSRKIKLH
jgi:TPR repeat protein